MCSSIDFLHSSVAFVLECYHETRDSMYFSDSQRSLSFFDNVERVHDILPLDTRPLTLKPLLCALVNPLSKHSSAPSLAVGSRI